MALKRLLVAVAIVTLLSFDVGIGAAQAMPFHSAQTGLTIPVASGCGIGIIAAPMTDATLSMAAITVPTIAHTPAAITTGTVRVTTMATTMAPTAR